MLEQAAILSGRGAELCPLEGVQSAKDLGEFN